MERLGNRANDEIRPVKITTNFTKYAAGSVLIEMGETKVICTATVEDKVPPFLRNTGTGWINAEYSMLPSSTQQRKIRDSVRGKIDGRTQEIQRLIGRAIRSVIDLDLLGERTIWVDCDVIQADGGTRTASITGGFVAAAQAIYRLYQNKEIKKLPIKNFVSAISAGVLNDEHILDLCYEEDSAAKVDMNFVMTDKGEFVEVQGTGEEAPFSREDLNKLLELGEKGNKELIKIQRAAIPEIGDAVLGMDYGKDVVIATGNKHKLQEIGDILKDFDYNVMSLKDVELDGIEIVEDGKTFEHNALIKARTISKLTKKISIADDSGLVVDCLGGKPGIYSARYAGEHATDEENRVKLFEAMKDVPMEDRTARFVSAIGVVLPDGKEFTVRGTVEGKITFEEHGENGFGYDCMFMPDGFDKTFGEIDPEIKNSMSHRANALKKMKEEFVKRVVR